MATGDESRPAGRSFKEEHVRRYRATNGEDGYLWNGAPVLLITTTGRRSGEPRTTPLVFARDGDRYLAVASRKGADDHPQWYLNLTAEPQIDVQVLGDRFRAIARTAGPHEKPSLWQKMVDVWPDYDEYQARTERVIPLVIIEPIDA